MSSCSAPSTITQADLDHFKALILQYRGMVWDLVSGGSDDPGWDKYRQRLALFDPDRIKTKPRKPPMVMVTDPSLRVELPLSLDLQSLPTQPR